MFLAKIDITASVELEDLSVSMHHDIAVMTASETTISAHAFTMVKVWQNMTLKHNF